MRTVLSATEHDYYAFPLPITAFCWNKIGIKSICFIPKDNNSKLELAKKYATEWCQFIEFKCDDFQIPTFSQVSRLFGAALNFEDENEILITGDSDLCVFSDFFNTLNDGNVHIVGADLTPEDQYPMCFIAMSVADWRRVMGINKSFQDHLEELISPIKSINLRGDAWCLDQWLIKKNIKESGIEKICLHNRAHPGTQFANNRVDRDDINWRSYLGPDLVDAHLWRPGHSEENFPKILELLQTQYPEENFQWVIDYRNEYVKTIL